MNMVVHAGTKIFLIPESVMALARRRPGSEHDVGGLGTGTCGDIKTGTAGAWAEPGPGTDGYCTCPGTGPGTPPHPGYTCPTTTGYRVHAGYC